MGSDSIDFQKIPNIALQRLAGLVLTNVANAAFPNGLWQVDHYDFVTKAKISTGTGRWCINSQML